MPKRKRSEENDDLELLRRLEEFQDRDVRQHRKRFKAFWTTTVPQLKSHDLLEPPIHGKRCSQVGHEVALEPSQSLAALGSSLTSQPVGLLFTQLLGILVTSSLSSLVSGQGMADSISKAVGGRHSSLSGNQETSGLVDGSSNLLSILSAIAGHQRNDIVPKHVWEQHLRSAGCQTPPREHVRTQEQWEAGAPGCEPEFPSRLSLFQFCARREAKAYTTLHGIVSGWEARFEDSVRFCWEAMPGWQKMAWKSFRRAHLEGKLKAHSDDFGRDLMAPFFVCHEGNVVLLRSRVS